MATVDSSALHFFLLLMTAGSSSTTSCRYEQSSEATHGDVQTLQFEAEISALEAAIREAATTRAHFFRNVYAAYVRFCDAVCLLNNAARLNTPVWLSLLDPALQTATAQSFCDALAALVTRLERRETNLWALEVASEIMIS